MTVDVSKAMGGDAPVLLGKYDTLAEVPAAAAALEGCITYASDVRKAGETAGNGTGAVIFCDSQPAWIVVDTGATAAA